MGLAIPGNPITSGKSNNGPSAPDFTKAATPNQTNAFGVNSQWSQGPNGQWNQQQSFNGPLGGAVQGLEGQIANQGPLGNGADARQTAEDALYGRSTSRLDPQFAQQEQQLQSQLANQGLTPGSEAYNNAYQNFSRARNDAYTQAREGAQAFGGQEQQRQFGMNLAAQEAPYQQLSQLAGLTGQSQNSLLPASMAQYSGDLQRYGIQQQGKNSMMNGMAGLGGAAMLA